ncbi:MAG: IdeS/Mac family cysteine endopeptidase [Akkermansia sp.]
MKRSALCLAILCALSHPSAWAETKELWAYGVSKDGGWYDTTKTWSGDTNLCWAATAANMLSWWQHWDTSAPDNNATPPQGALNIYNQLKTDYGYDLADSGSIIGVEWWFNGGASARQYYSAQYYQNKVNVFASGGGGYYTGLNMFLGVKDEDYFYASDYISYSDANTNLLKSMTSQRAIGLAISTGANVGHSITMWGLEYDTASNAVTKLYVTDSDDRGTGLFALDCSEKDGKMYLSSEYHATYKSGSYYLDSFFTLGLNSENNAAGEDPLSGYNSNFYALENGVITKVASESTPSVDDSGNVKFLGTTTLSQTSSAYELNLHAGSADSYKEIINVDFGGNTVSMSRVRLEAQGNVTANRALLEIMNSTLIGKSISLSNSTEVKMTNAWIETTGTNKGESTGTTFKGTGTIKNMKITGGSIISGNSPGLTTLEDTELVSSTLSFYLGVGDGKELSVPQDGHTKIDLNTTLGAGVLSGTKTEVSSGFLLTSSVSLSQTITLDVWNIEGQDGTRSFSFMNYDNETYFGEGDYIQVIAFGDGVTYHDVLGTTFTLSDNITTELLKLRDSNLETNATWQKQVRTDGVYLVLSSAAVLDVPEPTTGVLVLTGLGLLLRRRRRVA